MIFLDNYITKEEFEELLNDPSCLIGSYARNLDGSLLEVYCQEGSALAEAFDKYSAMDPEDPTAKAWLERYFQYAPADEDDEDKEEYLVDNLGLFTLLRIDELGDIEEEAADRVWYDRKASPESYFDNPDLTDDHKKSIFEAIERVKTKYDIDDEECDDFYHGYWSGILALCRYLTQTTKEDYSIEDLRSGAGLLDT